jgi:hypothetical protein
MRNKVPESTGGWRRVALACIAVAGLVTIVGSGGGGGGDDAPECSFFSNRCTFTFGPSDPVPPQPFATIYPGRLTVQVGTPAVFSATSDIPLPSYSWCRLPKDASDCAAIEGATGPTYTLTSANLSDDGAVFRVSVTGATGTAIAASWVAVSSMPGVVFQDGEFLESDWAMTTILDPPLDGPKVSALRSATGGNPGAYRSLSYELPAVPSSVRVFNTALFAIYDPAVNGAIHVIDFWEDCTNIETSEGLAYTLPMFEQGGRQYTVSNAGRLACYSPGWYGRRRSSLSAGDFVLANGPACGAGESCPDLSASGAPMRFGLFTGREQKSQLAAGTIARVEHGVDNWKVTVWRR